jgi:hypothetical protein
MRQVVLSRTAVAPTVNRFAGPQPEAGGEVTGRGVEALVVTAGDTATGRLAGCDRSGMEAYAATPPATATTTVTAATTARMPGRRCGTTGAGAGGEIGDDGESVASNRSTGVSPRSWTRHVRQSRMFPAHRPAFRFE